MATERQQFIGNLVAGHRPRRALMLPGRRALVWLAASTLLTVVLMLCVQVFRPGVLSQLKSYPLLLVEVLSALLIVPFAACICFTRAVPGSRAPRSVVMAFWFLAVTLSVGLALSCAHTDLTPPSSAAGARHWCWLEVLVYGGLSLGLFLVMARRGYLRFSSTSGTLAGLMGGLLPAALMQLACMYDPSHGLVFHYAPVIVLACTGLLGLHLLRR